MKLNTTPKIYNLKNDVIFNTFFSRKGNEEFLIDFLQALLKIEITKIEIREQVNLEKLARDEKGGRLDLQAQLNNGIIINIELQIKMKAIWVNMVICTVLIVYLSGILDVAGLLIAKITRRHHD